MRLLFATTFGHLPELIGGLQTTTDELAHALQRRAIDVAVLCGAIEDDAAAPVSDRVCGYQVVRAPDPAAALPAGFRPVGTAAGPRADGAEMGARLGAALAPGARARAGSYP